LFLAGKRFLLQKNHGNSCSGHIVRLNQNLNILNGIRFSGIFDRTLIDTYRFIVHCGHPAMHDGGHLAFPITLLVVALHDYIIECIQQIATGF